MYSEDSSATNLVYTLQVLEGPKPCVTLYPCSIVHEVLRRAHEVDNILL